MSFSLSSLSSLPQSGGAFDQLQALPRCELGQWPTALQPLRRISSHLGGPQIWVKRDDCSGLATGGNKTRKLEFLLGDAQAKGCNTLITQGALQSNHARQTAAAGAVMGMPVHVVLSEAVPGRDAAYGQLGNIQMCRLLGAQVHVIAADDDADAYCAQLAAQLQAQGQQPYVVPMGGSSGMGALGYAAAFAELYVQMRDQGTPMDAVVVATGSGGTQAGLMLGAALLGWQGRIHGVSVSPDYALGSQRIRQALTEAAGHVGLAPNAVQDLPVHLDVGFKGPHYGIPDSTTVPALELAARQEGLLLDPVYSGKGFAGLLVACAPGGALADAQHVVFLHTGGTAALSVYPEVGHA